jgi:hypothetical protein
MQGKVSERETAMIAQTQSELARWAFMTERHDAFLLTDIVKEKHQKSLNRRLSLLGQHADLEWFNVRFLTDVCVIHSSTHPFIHPLIC